MIAETQAREIAEKDRPKGVVLGLTRELREGWFFPWETSRVGCSGVVVHKATGRILHLGSTFSIGRDLEMYDRGYQFERYDLVILAIHDLEATRHALTKIRFSEVEITYEHGQVWRIPKELPHHELRKRLEILPCVFPDVQLYFKLELLEQARHERWFEFAALDFRVRPSSS